MDMNARQVEEQARMLQERLAPQIDQARQNLTDLNRKVVSFVRENPGTCLIGAVALGFIVGKLAARR